MLQIMPFPISCQDAPLSKPNWKPEGREIKETFYTGQPPWAYSGIEKGEQTLGHRKQPVPMTYVTVGENGTFSPRVHRRRGGLVNASHLSFPQGQIRFPGSTKKKVYLAAVIIIIDGGGYWFSLHASTSSLFFSLSFYLETW